LNEAKVPETRISRKILIPVVLILLAVVGFFVIRNSPAPKQKSPVPASGVEAPKLVSLAVLPFKNETGDSSFDSLGVGLADAVSTSLAASKEMVVRPLTSVLAYRKSDPLVAAKSLAVDQIVDGIFLRSGNKIRVSIQVLDSHQGNSIWSDHAESEIQDLFELQ